ncbi:MAG TPA: F0F1 ATP synthase subunit delta [Candidatus Sulfotelmatobacter sp.]|nr:F0F1 ATP synthase subunit delta [Candidatus Sulfotelmatobacter sp.]
MTKKQIVSIASKSFTNNRLDSKKVNRIIRLLKRKELKIYIKALKILENNKTVTIFSPKKDKRNNLLNDFKLIFPDKKIIFKEDPSLIAGIRVINSDDVYDFNIKNSLKSLVTYIRN